MTNEDLDLKTLYDYLKEGNYTQLPGNVKDAAYRISVDHKYADLANSIRNVLDYLVMDESMEDHTSLDLKDFTIATEEVAKYLKEDEFAKEQYDFDNALDPAKKEELERIIIKYREQYNSFYHDCVSEYIGEKQITKTQNDITTNKTNKMSLILKDDVPDSELNDDLNNRGYVNLLFTAIILTAIAFFILFKIF